jgi:tripartite ATP-independent transporter DctM subunit
VEWYSALALMLGLLIAFMAIGLPVAFAFFAVNVVGAMVFLGGAVGLSQLARNAMASLTSFALAPIPLFLLMGEVLFHTGVAFKAVDAIDKLISRVPGRLSIVSILGGTIFASLSGSTVANTAMLGSILLPEMLRRGYHPVMAMGPIMATGGIAMLIPPSALAVLLGSLADISIARLLIAGIVPGLMMSVFFLAYVVGRCSLNPSLAPAYDVKALGWGERLRPVLIRVLPLFAIFFVVVGSIIGGIATPTESAALGSVASILAAAAYRELRWRDLIVATRETAKISVMILFIIVASITFSQILAFSGAANGMLALMSQLGYSANAVVIGMVAVLLFLGMFMDQVSMMMITLPFFMPLSRQLGIDPVWLGVLILVALEIGFTTPPFGLILYVMHGVAPKGTTMKQIIQAVTPFIVLELLVLLLLFAFPALSTWLPSVTLR